MGKLFAKIQATPRKWLYLAAGVMVCAVPQSFGSASAQEGPSWCSASSRNPVQAHHIIMDRHFGGGVRALYLCDEINYPPGSVTGISPTEAAARAAHTLMSEIEAQTSDHVRAVDHGRNPDRMREIEYRIVKRWVAAAIDAGSIRPDTFSVGEAIHEAHLIDDREAECENAADSTLRERLVAAEGEGLDEVVCSPPFADPEFTQMDRGPTQVSISFSLTGGWIDGGFFNSRLEAWTPVRSDVVVSVGFARTDTLTVRARKIADGPYTQWVLTPGEERVTVERIDPPAPPVEEPAPPPDDEEETP